MKRVEVTWTDSVMVNEGWLPATDYMHKARLDNVCRTVGYLVADEKDKILVAMNWDPTRDLIGDAVAIPRVAVHSVTELRDKPQPRPKPRTTRSRKR